MNICTATNSNPATDRLLMSIGLLSNFIIIIDLKRHVAKLANQIKIVGKSIEQQCPK